MNDAIKLFEKDLGTWEGEIEVRPYPGAQPQTSRGVMTNRVLGGRWLISELKNESGFEGHGIYGWDDAKQRYVGTWVDGMRGQLVLAEGTYDEASHTMTYRFELTHQGKTFTARDVTQLLDAYSLVFRSFIEMGDAPPHEVVTATYRRRR